MFSTAYCQCSAGYGVHSVYHNDCFNSNFACFLASQLKLTSSARSRGDEACPFRSDG